MKKKPVFIILSVAALITLIYTGTWQYCMHYVWLPHLPDQSKIDYVKTQGAWTYYYLKPDEDGCLYRMLVPTFSGFTNGRCVLDVVSNFAYPDVDGETESGQDAGKSIISFTAACPIYLNGKLKSYGFMINATFSDDDCASVAYFDLSPDMELNNKDELSAPELKLYQKSLPEMERICKKFHELFSV